MVDSPNPFSFKYTGKSGGDYHFALVGPTKRGLPALHMENQVVEWKLNESSNEGVEVAHTEHTLEVRIKHLADLIFFEERFGSTGISIDNVLADELQPA